MKGDVRRNLRRGVYVIPTSLTVLNLFFGFRSIINCTWALQAITSGRGDQALHYFEVACISLFIAAIFDTFDGLIARARRDERVRQGVRLARRRRHVRRRSRHPRLRLGPPRPRQPRRRDRVPLPRRRLAPPGALQRDDRQDRLPLLRRPAQSCRRADDRRDRELRARAGRRPSLCAGDARGDRGRGVRDGLLRSATAARRAWPCRRNGR